MLLSSEVCRAIVNVNCSDPWHDLMTAKNIQNDTQSLCQSISCWKAHNIAQILTMLRGTKATERLLTTEQGFEMCAEHGLCGHDEVIKLSTRAVTSETAKTLAQTLCAGTKVVLTGEQVCRLWINMNHTSFHNEVRRHCPRKNWIFVTEGK